MLQLVKDFCHRLFKGAATPWGDEHQASAWRLDLLAGNSDTAALVGHMAQLTTGCDGRFQEIEVPLLKEMSGKMVFLNQPSVAILPLLL
jgi:hypothetical protein